MAKNTNSETELNQKPVGNIDGGLMYKFIVGSTAAVMAETVTYPMDLTKTRLQIQGEVSSLGPTVAHSNRGMFQIIHGIVTEEGILKLWQGVLPALYRQIVYSGCRMATYEFLRDKVFQKDENGIVPLWAATLSSGTAGAVGQFLASPTDLVKVNMQMEGRRRLEGKPARIHSCSHAFRQIVSETGVSGLWRGWVPNVHRAVLVNVGDIVTYDLVKHELLLNTQLGDNWVLHTISSACSGLVATFMCQPADVIKSRVMNQPVKDGRAMLYKGSVDCLIKTVRQEGFMALYKGFLPAYCRLSPWFLTFWIVYEELRTLSGHSSF